MLHVTIDSEVSHQPSSFKIGVLIYHHITVKASPQMLQGRLKLYYEEKGWELEGKLVSDLPGIREWRDLFKSFGTDPSRYRPSHEALIRRLIKGQEIPEINSAVDMNNFFSIRYGIPMGLYDLSHIDGNRIQIRIGQSDDFYIGMNGREMTMRDKLLSSDGTGAFGSPIVDSKRTMVTEDTTEGLQLLYFCPSTSEQEAHSIVNDIKTQFLHIHGGESESLLAGF